MLTTRLADVFFSIQRKILDITQVVIVQVEIEIARMTPSGTVNASSTCLFQECVNLHVDLEYRGP